MSEIKSVGELDGMPHLAVVVDADGDAWQKRYDDERPWVMAGLNSEPETSEELAGYGPFHLVWTPPESGARA